MDVTTGQYLLWLSLDVDTVPQGDFIMQSIKQQCIRVAL